MRTGFIEKTSPLLEETAVYRHIIPPGDPWIHPLKQGQTIRIVDLKGNQAVDTIFYNSHDLEERYSALDTIAGQGNVYLTTGTLLMSNKGRVLAEISADLCGFHDTLGGACAAESNSVRYPLEKKHMHSCRDNFLKAIREYDQSMTKRDIPNNMNFFMNVPVDSEGGSAFSDGVSGAGKYVEMIAKMNVLCLISNCPQLNNPCNGYDPTPVEVLIWD
jgi:urea carboxylase-associated protein 1